jgi:hypothetical protein
MPNQHKKLWVKYVDHEGNFSANDEVVLSYAMGGSTGPAGPTGSTAALQGTMTGHIIPDLDNGYDIGSAQYKVRDMYVSDNSLHIGSTTLSEENVDRSMEITPDEPPTSPTDTGKKGDVRIDTTHIYICTDTDTWKRLSLETTW